MTIEPQPTHEAERLEALRACGAVESGPEAQFDSLARLAASVCETPYATVSLVDEDVCWLKAAHGFAPHPQSRAEWFCARTISRPGEATIVRAQPAVTPAGAPDAIVSFYAGAPIMSSDHAFAFGAVAVLDSTDRTLSDGQIAALFDLSRQASALLELRRTANLLDLATVKLQMLEDKDAVTGLPSDRMFRAQLRTEFQYARRHNQPLCLVLIDIDGFGQITESYGAERGDEILRRVARLITRDTRDYDLVARCGCNEFAIVMRGAAACTGARVAHRLKSRMASMEWPGEPVTVSLGVASISPDMIGSRDLADRARKSLRESMSRGRGAVAVAES